MAAKIGPAGLILAAKVIWGTNFGSFFCQKRSGGTDFGVTVLNKRKYGVQYLECVSCMWCHDGEKHGGGFISCALQFSSLCLAKVLIYVTNIL